MVHAAATLSTTAYTFEFVISCGRQAPAAAGSHVPNGEATAASYLSIAGGQQSAVVLALEAIPFDGSWAPAAGTAVYCSIGPMAGGDWMPPYAGYTVDLAVRLTALRAPAGPAFSRLVAGSYYPVVTTLQRGSPLLLWTRPVRPTSWRFRADPRSYGGTGTDVRLQCSTREPTLFANGSVVFPASAAVQEGSPYLGSGNEVVFPAIPSIPTPAGSPWQLGDSLFCAVSHAAASSAGVTAAISVLDGIVIPTPAATPSASPPPPPTPPPSPAPSADATPSSSPLAAVVIDGDAFTAALTANQALYARASYRSVHMLQVSYSPQPGSGRALQLRLRCPSTSTSTSASSWGAVPSNLRLEVSPLAPTAQQPSALIGPDSLNVTGGADAVVFYQRPEEWWNPGPASELLLLISDDDVVMAPHVMRGAMYARITLPYAAGQAQEASYVLEVRSLGPDEAAAAAAAAAASSGGSAATPSPAPPLPAGTLIFNATLTGAAPAPVSRTLSSGGSISYVFDAPQRARYGTASLSLRMLEPSLDAPASYISVCTSTRRFFDSSAQCSGAERTCSRCSQASSIVVRVPVGDALQRSRLFVTVTSTLTSSSPPRMVQLSAAYVDAEAEADGASSAAAAALPTGAIIGIGAAAGAVALVGVIYGVARCKRRASRKGTSHGSSGEVNMSWHRNTAGPGRPRAHGHGHGPAGDMAMLVAPPSLAGHYPLASSASVQGSAAGGGLYGYAGAGSPRKSSSGPGPGLLQPVISMPLPFPSPSAPPGSYVGDPAAVPRRPSLRQHSAGSSSRSGMMMMGRAAAQPAASAASSPLRSAPSYSASTFAPLAAPPYAGAGARRGTADPVALSVAAAVSSASGPIVTQAGVQPSSQPQPGQWTGGRSMFL